MKKKTALTLSALVLLSAGITFGVKFKQKKDFEKILKTILIPNAEKELDKLLKEDVSLNDTISYYHALLLQQSSEADGQKIAEKHDKLLGTSNQNMYSVLSEISKILKLMEEDYIKEYKKTNKERDAYRIGDGEYRGVPKKLQERYNYMTRGITEPLAYGENITYIPGGFQQYCGSRYNDASYDFLDRLSFDEFTEYLRYELKATRGQFTTSGTNGNRVFYAITEASEIKQLLIAIKYFINNIDNSKRIINPEHIKTLNKQIDTLIPVIEKQITLEKTTDATSTKLEKFKTSKESLKSKIKQQQEKINVLKTTDVKKLMKQQHGK